MFVVGLQHSLPTAKHCMRLPGSGLPIGEESCIVPFKQFVHKMLHLLVDCALRFVLIDVVEVVHPVLKGLLIDGDEVVIELC